MASIETPVCEFGTAAVDFALPGVDGRNWTLEQCRGEKGLLVMFICNHCPYVQAIRQRLVRATEELLEHGVRSVAIMSNDPLEYPEDSFENMRKIAASENFPFPYLFDESQRVAKAYGAVCTPDFFGYNAELALQYRGRFDASGRAPGPTDNLRDLYDAMVAIARTGRGPAHQIPGIGCSIKWKTGAA